MWCDPISEPQVKFIEILLDKREVPEGQVAHFKIMAKNLDRRQANIWITRLKQLPKRGTGNPQPELLRVLETV